MKRVVYRGPADRLVVDEIEMERDGDSVEVSDAIYARLKADKTVRLEVVLPAKTARKENPWANPLR